MTFCSKKWIVFDVVFRLRNFSMRNSYAGRNYYDILEMSVLPDFRLISWYFLSGDSMFLRMCSSDKGRQFCFRLQVLFPSQTALPRFV